MKTELFIVSMTSYPPRFSNLVNCLRSLKDQTVYPEKLILNVAFEDVTCLPADLKDLQLPFPIEINGTENIGPAKKLIPTLKRYPNSAIVTIDDDIHYPSNLLRNLLDESALNPDAIICSRAHQPSFVGGFPNPYISWQFEVKNHSDRLCCPTSGAGTFFPPLSLHEDVCDTEQYKSLSFSSDDLWYWIHAIRNRTRIIKTKESFPIYEFNNDAAAPLHSANIMVLNSYNLEKMWLSFDMKKELQDYCDELQLKISTKEDLSEYQRMLLDFSLGFSNTTLYELLDRLPVDLQVKMAREVSVGYQKSLELMMLSRTFSFSSRQVAHNLARKIRKIIKK